MPMPMHGYGRSRGQLALAGQPAETEPVGVSRNTQEENEP